MSPLQDHHHFKADLIDPSDRVARIERKVVDILLHSSLPDSQRESSIAFELKHHAGIAQFARVLARKRGLPIETCTVGALLHDIYVIMYGKYKDHAPLGAPIAEGIISEVGNFTAEEISQILRIIYHHSDKHLWSEDAFQEFGKDADILDCFLYPNAFGYYLRHKPLPVFFHYLVRAENVWRELTIPHEPEFNLLDHYSDNWFRLCSSLDTKSIKSVLSLLLQLSSTDKQNGLYPPAFCIILQDDEAKIYTNEENWNDFLSRLRENRSALKHYFRTHLTLGGDPLSGLGEPIPEYLDIFRTPLLVMKESFEFAANEFLLAAEKLLTNAQQRDALIMVWPSIESYELLEGEQKRARLGELGLDPSIK